MSFVQADEYVEFKEALHRCAGARTIAVGLLGCGRVGQAVSALTAAEHGRLSALGWDVRIETALVRDTAKPRTGPAVALTTSAQDFFRRRWDLVIEVMGGVTPAFDYVKAALERGIPVVTANKTLMAERGEELAAISRFHRAPLAFDAAVLAGVPFLGALSRRPFINTPRRITGIINGTSHYLVSALAAGGTFSDALLAAIASGYAEPDSAADVSGRDAAEKLTILLRLSGVRDLSVSDLPTVGIDRLTSADFTLAERLGCVIKPLAIASLERGREGAWVGPALVERSHAASATRGVFNFVELAGAASLPVTFSGPGAGPDVTAATILDDVVEVLSTGGRPDPISPPSRGPVGAALRTPPPAPWYARVARPAGDVDLLVDDIAELFACHRVPATQLIERDGFIACRTSEASWARVQEVAGTLRAIGADVLVLPVVEGGRS